MVKQTDFFGRDIKDGDFILRAKNAGRSYTMEVLLIVDVSDGKRKYISVSRTYAHTGARLPCGSSATIVEPELVEAQYPDGFKQALQLAKELKTPMLK
ncbi:hypothetical protein VPFG_00189 [Vibrio phage nt-1]|uniref:Uncharacterized protein n=1 Tax=Vibrio phage nt-1 TaxID=115992 RepID=R9TFE5_9CAUD|nr:hypothetical protein VPFG_00189 [Vibrio phage nt-1]AGN30189.1 hypothetical protein VPFG_00189 [Vibrio phage nt-1]